MGGARDDKLAATEAGMALKRATFAAWAALASALLGAVSLTGCAGSQPPEEGRKQEEKSDEKSDEKPEEKPINQAQLQDQLQRFAGVFTDRLVEAAEPLAAPDTPRRSRKIASRQVLVYVASVLDIVTGRYPEANLLDLLAFMQLARGVLEEYWIPEVYGEAGRPMAEAFARSATDLERLVPGLLSRAQVEEIRSLVVAWRKENPKQHRVEQVRLFSISETTGRLADAREREASGLLSSLSAATQSADQAMLLAERTLFLAQRMPFLIRWQAKIGAQEVTDEVLTALDQSDATLQKANVLAEKSGQAVVDLRKVIEILKPLFEPSEGREPLRLERLLARTENVVDDSHKLVRDLGNVERALASADRATDKSQALVTKMRGLLPAEDASPLLALVHDGLMWGTALGALLVSLFWGGYVVAHRLTRDEGRGRRGAPPSPQMSRAAAGQGRTGAS